MPDRMLEFFAAADNWLKRSLTTATAGAALST
jgi:hypothetical protein